MTDVSDAIARIVNAATSYQPDDAIGGEWSVPVMPSDLKILLNTLKFSIEGEKIALEGIQTLEREMNAIVEKFNAHVTARKEAEA